MHMKMSVRMFALQLLQLSAQLLKAVLVLGDGDRRRGRLTSSPKTVPVAVKESIRAAGPERIFLDATETTFSGPDYREAA